MKDPNRLGDFRRLREEEKTRNRVNKKLPNISRDLEEMTSKYYAEHGVVFTIDGLTFSELLERQNASKGHKKGLVGKTFKGGSFRWKPAHNSTTTSEAAFTLARKMSQTH